MRFDGREGLVLNAQSSCQGPQAHAPFLVLRIGQKTLNLVVSHNSEDVCLRAARGPAEQQCAERSLDVLPACGMLPLLIGKPAEAQARPGESLKETYSYATTT